jgi:cell division protein FtsQ
LLGKKKTHKTRRNRYKKDAQLMYRRLLRYVMITAKCGGLLVLLLAVSAVFVAGYAAVTSSDYFRTQSIEIKGRQRLARSHILEQAGLREGDNLLSVNLHLVRKKLAAHAWIAQAQIARDIPGTITIHIREHQPLALIDLGQRFLMNVDGRIFKEYAKDEPGNLPLDLPLITGISYADISLGDDALSPVLESVLQVLRFCRSGNSALPFESIEHIHFDAQMGISVTQRQNQRVFNLGLDQYETKLLRLKRLLRYLQRHDQWQAFKEVDLNNPDRVVVQLHEEQGA